MIRVNRVVSTTCYHLIKGAPCHPHRHFTTFTWRIYYHVSLAFPSRTNFRLLYYLGAGGEWQVLVFRTKPDAMLLQEFGLLLLLLSLGVALETCTGLRRLSPQARQINGEVQFGLQGNAGIVICVCVSLYSILYCIVPFVFGWSNLT